MKAGLMSLETILLKKKTKSSGYSKDTEKNSSGCYIATMVYGSYEAPEVIALRQFRDQKLIKNPVGKLFVKIYYQTSPSFVRLTKNWKWLHQILRNQLNKLIKNLK